jgi:hypothetical protein
MAICVECIVGYFSGSGVTVEDLSTPCKGCSRGTYADEKGLANCVECPTGYTMPHNNNQRTQCYSCEFGEYMNEKGSFALSCKLCQKGKFNDQSAQASCTNCPSGFVTGDTGNKDCSMCGGGSYSAGSMGQTCKNCLAGQFIQLAGTSGCKTCPLGFWQEDSGKTLCKACDLGKYGGGSSCNVCPQGTYLDENSQKLLTDCKGRLFLVVQRWICFGIKLFWKDLVKLMLLVHFSCFILSFFIPFV